MPPSGHPSEIRHQRAIKVKGGAGLLRLVEYEDDSRVVWYEVPEGDWIVCYRLVPEDGRPVVGELRVMPGPLGRREPGTVPWSRRPPLGGLPASIVRGLRVGAHQDAATQVMQEWAKWLGQDVFSSEGIFGAAGLREASKPAKRRGASTAELEHARLARDYVELLNKGDRTPIKTLAERRTPDRARHRLDDNARHVREAINRARQRYHLLTPSPPGRPGGQLTEKALRILQGEA